MASQASSRPLNFRAVPRAPDASFTSGKAVPIARTTSKSQRGAFVMRSIPRCASWLPRMRPQSDDAMPSRLAKPRLSQLPKLGRNPMEPRLNGWVTCHRGAEPEECVHRGRQHVGYVHGSMATTKEVREARQYSWRC